MRLPIRRSPGNDDVASMRVVAAVIATSLMLAAGFNTASGAEFTPSNPTDSATDSTQPGSSDSRPADQTDGGKHRSALSRYPTDTEVYYVLACMQVNGQNAEGMRRCSCAINFLEARLSYDQFKDAQLVVAMRQAGGRNAAIFRDAAPMQSIISDFTRAQDAANTECFGESSAAGPTTSKQSIPGQ